MKTSQRTVCFIVVVLGFTFFAGVAESKGAQGSVGQYLAISYGVDL